MMLSRTFRTLGFLLLGTVGGCSYGSQNGPPHVIPAAASVHAAPSVDRALFDSLARTTRAAPILAQGVAFDAEGKAALAWLDVIKDTTLVGLVRTALRDNRDIRAAIGRVNEYRALAGVARSALLPEIDANASASANQATFIGAPPVAYRAVRLTADLQWELDFWGRIRLGIAASEADLAARSQDERALVLTLVADISNAYLELLEARSDREIAESTLTSRQNTLGLARQRYSQGVISELDVRQFEADVAAAASSVALYTRVASQQAHALALLAGQTPDMAVAAGKLDSAVAAVRVPDSVSAQLLLRRPDVASAERALAAEEARYGATRASVLPRFLITGEYGRQSETFSNLFGSDAEIYTAQIGVSVPIFTGGRESAQINAGRARVEQARARYEQSVLTALNEAADALVATRTNRDQLAALAAQADALRDAYRLAERRYEGGIASYLEVLEAQRGSFSAELALTQAERNYLEATVRLYQALGGEWQ